MDDAIRIERVVKKFGSLAAVNGVSFSIKSGEVFGLLGPNGAGKTTLINMMLGLLEATSGKIYINGMDVDSDIIRIKSGIGFVTQETVVEGELTAVENLWLFARLYHVQEEKIDGKIHELLKLASLEEFKDSYAGTFSGGMQRRLAVVKALIHDPHLLVLDEPTVGLDVQNRTELWNLLRKINKEQGVTILLTTQYLEEADALCNRISIIDHGKIVGIGTPAQLKQSIGMGALIEISAEKEYLNDVSKIMARQLGGSPQVSGDKVTVPYSGNVQLALDRLLKRINAEKIRVTSISVHQPTLDDVFLKLTGTSLRDVASETAPSSRELMRHRMG